MKHWYTLIYRESWNHGMFSNFITESSKNEKSFMLNGIMAEAQLSLIIMRLEK
jgi:hypothetical protein